ncbi:MAG TPA: PAS domain-containing protein [Falsiroseomonas sp.]|jgi:PAS domain S-box-containing protein|nr:PAS domain-containing protein [Falsiroseomonas sp.]
MHGGEFQRFQRSLGLGGGGRVGLFRIPDGAALMLHPLPGGPDATADPPPAIRFAPSAALLRAAAMGEVRAGRFTTRLPEGGTLLVAWRVAGHAGPVLAAAALPRAQALASFRARLTRNAVLLGIAVAVVIGLGALVAASLARGAELRNRAQAGQRDLSAVLEATGEGVFVLDQLWRIGFLNTRAAEALADGADLTGQVLWEALPELAGTPIAAVCRETMRHRERAEAEADLPHRGRRFRVESHPREDGGIVAFFRDITKEHAAAARLAESEARRRQVLDNLFVFVGVLAPDGTLLEANRAPLEAAGLTLADVRGVPFWDCYWWAYDAAVQARLREACVRAAAGEASRYDVAVRMAGDRRMTIDFQIAPLFDAAGRVTHLIPSATDITGRSQAEAALAESEARLRLAQEAAEVGVFERAMPGETAHWSTSMFRLYGLDPAGRSSLVTAAEHLALLHPAERETHAVRRAAMRADPSISRFSYEFRIIRADTGETRWLASRGEVVRDAEGRPELVRGINYDVTDRRRAEERQLLLAREVDHRAKNALAVVQAIVGLTRDADPAQFRAAVTGRIAAMARAHNLLAREGWDGAELRELIEEELAPHRAAAPGGVERVTLHGAPVALGAGAAQPLAMALHELATNAVKYGALSTAAGTVAIAWEATAETGLDLSWIERGGPLLLEGAPARRGFGSSVIRNTVQRQLHGKVRFDWPAEGLECRLTLPRAELRWPEAAERSSTAG